jgi:hypothetical protein
LEVRRKEGSPLRFERLTKPLVSVPKKEIEKEAKQSGR